MVTVRVLEKTKWWKFPVERHYVINSQTEELIELADGTHRVVPIQKTLLEEIFEEESVENNIKAKFTQAVMEEIAKKSYVVISELVDAVMFHGTDMPYGFYEEKIDNMKNHLMAFCMQVEIQKPENKAPKFNH